MPNALWPAARPRRSPAEVLATLEAHGVKKGPAILGVRGYYRDTMGAPGKNDRGIYDDAAFLVRADKSVVAFNVNLDPAIHRNGIATLAPGLYYYELGAHRGKYPCLRQASKVTVQRDRPHGANEAPAHETGFFGINWHRGGVSATHSEGCQTVVPHQYDEFLLAVVAEMLRAVVAQIPYLLVEEPPA